MAKVFLDTNVIIGERFFRFPFVEGVLKKAKFLGFTVLIPEIVIDEAKANFKLKLEECLDQHKKSQKQLGKFANLPASANILDYSNYLDNEINQYNNFLDNILATYGVVILPYPEIPIKEIVAKSYEANKPFKADGEGYKDYVIWQTIKEYCDNYFGIEEKFFITGNKSDFCDSGSGAPSLHCDLVASLSKPERAPKMILSFREFFNLKIEPSLKNVNPKDIPDVNIQETIDDIFLEELLDYEAYGFIGLPFEGEVIISFILEASRIDDVSFSELGKDSILITVKGAVYVEVDGYMNKSEYYASDDENIYVCDADVNDHVMAVSQPLETTFELAIVCSKKDNKVLDYKMNLPDEIRPDY